MWPRSEPERTASTNLRICEQHSEHVGHDIAAIDQHAGPRAIAQRRVQHRALFGVIDALAGEHRCDLRRHARMLGQRQEQRQRLLDDAVLGVIQEQTAASVENF